MEHSGAASVLDWSSFNATEGSDVMEQLLGPCTFSDEQDNDPIFGSIPMFDFDSYYWPQVSTGDSTSANSFLPPSQSDMYCLGYQNITQMMDLCTNEGSPVQVVPNHQLEEPNYLNEVCGGDDHGDSNVPISLNDHTSLSKRKLHTGNEEPSMPIKTPKKKARVSVKANKSTKNVRSKKAQKNVEEGSNAASSCSSDNDSNASEELNGGSGASCSSKETAALNVNGKTRASRGSAVDPQSLYARKRRERINERLRVLQKLVPNGTKVDISTMLEEAVDYVKFLQLQIKLLSSNDMWMYAPIAYNGMDLGIGATISPPK